MSTNVSLELSEAKLGKKDFSMYRKSALAEYSNIDVETKTSTQNPKELITMLFDKACVLLRQSQVQFEKGHNEGFLDSTNHAMQIVLGLRGVLDLENGGALAAQLYETYTAISASLFKARSDGDAEAIAKLYLAMTELKEGWEQAQV